VPSSRLVVVDAKILQEKEFCSIGRPQIPFVWRFDSVGLEVCPKSRSCREQKGTEATDDLLDPLGRCGPRQLPDTDATDERLTRGLGRIWLVSDMSEQVRSREKCGIGPIQEIPEPGAKSLRITGL